MDLRHHLLATLLLSVTPALAQNVTIDPPTRTFTKDGGGGSILTSGTGTWTASSNVTWINITPRTSGNAGESCIYVVNSNFSADTRQGIISIGGKSHTVTQTGYAATLTPSSGTAGTSGGTGSITVSVGAGVAWSALSSAPGWLTVTPASGLSNGSVTWTAAENPGVTTRTASLTIAGRTFPVTQTGTDVNLAPKSAEKAHGSDIVQVQVTALASTTWRVTPNASWISVIDQGNGFGDSTVTLAIGTNPSFLERSGTVTIGSATFTILQNGTSNPALDILPREASADPVGAFGNIAVLATPDAPWSAQSLDPWIILAQGSSGAGNGNVQYVVSANPTLTSRSGRIRINPPVYQPPVSLSWLLMSHFADDASDRTGWGRALSRNLNTRFNGTNPVSVAGPPFERGSDDSLSLCLRFELGEINAVNRLLEVTRSTGSFSSIYTDSSNRLNLRVGTEILTTSLTVDQGTTYQLVLSTDANRSVRVFAAPVGTPTIPEIGARTFAIPPFPADSVTPSSFVLGSGSIPIPGNLNNAALNDLRIYGRALNAREALAIHQAALTSDPYQLEPETGSLTPTLRLPLNGNGISKSSVPSVDVSAWQRTPDRNGLPGGAVNSDGTGSVRIGSGRFEQVPGSFSWQQSKSDAIARGGRLAILNTATKAANITSRRMFGWIGLTDEASEGAWKWIDGTPLGYANWFRFEPNNQNNEDHAEVLADGTWNDRSGDSRQPYIIEFPASAANLSSTQDLTSILWVRFDTLPESVGSLIQYDSKNGIQLRLSSGPSLDLAFGSDATIASFPAPLNRGEWHQIVLSGKSGGLARLFVDGAEIGNTPGLGSYNYGSMIPSIGGWNGALDEVSFYGDALTPSQVRALYAAEKPATVYHTVTQGVVDPLISSQSASVPAAGGAVSTELTIAQNVTWTASASVPWLSFISPDNGSGSATVTVQASANPTVYPRTGSITVAGKILTISQSGLNAAVQYTDTIFPTDGGSAWVDVAPEGNAQWQAVSSAPWLTVAIGAAGTGPGSVFLVADPYTNTSQSRTGLVTIAGKPVYFTQRGYSLSVSPQVAQVGSNAGAGEFGVAAPLTAVWEAIATHPWITITGSANGLGNGTIRYSLAANLSGQSRTGKIIVSGTEYAITQLSSLLVTLNSGPGGTATGGGPFDVNSVARLSAIPVPGFVFSHWTGDAVGSANPLSLAIDSNKSVQANFIPATASELFFNTGAQSVIGNPSAFGLFREDQLRAMAIGRPVLKVNPITRKGSVQLGIRQSSDLKSWTSLPVTGADVFVRDGNLEIEFNAHSNASFYQLFGNESAP